MIFRELWKYIYFLLHKTKWKFKMISLNLIFFTGNCNSHHPLTTYPPAPAKKKTKKTNKTKQTCSEKKILQQSLILLLCKNSVVRVTLLLWLNPLRDFFFLNHYLYWAPLKRWWKTRSPWVICLWNPFLAQFSGLKNGFQIKELKVFWSICLFRW